MERLMKLERTSKSVQNIPVDNFGLQVELGDPIFSGDPLLELDDVLSIGLAPVSLDQAKSGQREWARPRRRRGGQRRRNASRAGQADEGRIEGTKRALRRRAINGEELVPLLYWVSFRRSQKPRQYMAKTEL
jgi:hypothetical protein